MPGMVSKEDAAPARMALDARWLGRLLSKASPFIAILFVVVVVWRDHAGQCQASVGPPTAPATTGCALKYGYGPNPRDHGDFDFLYGAARVVTSHEANLLYTSPGSQERSRQWFATHGYIFPVFYPYPPAGALATALVLPFGNANGYEFWRYGVALATALLAVCVASAFRTWPWRIAVCVALAFWYPMLLNAHIGQTGAFIAATVALFTLIYIRRPKLGAILLGFVAVKPTAAIGPGLFLLQDRAAVWLRFAAVAAAVILLPFLILGPEAFFKWVDILTLRTWRDVGGGHSYNQGFSSIFGKTSVIGLVVAVALLLVAIALTHAVQLKLGAYVAMAFALILGMLVNPHSLVYDWGIAFVALMLLRKSQLLPESWGDLGYGLLMIVLFVAGQYSWQIRHELGHGLRPLTVWALVIELTLLVLAFRAGAARSLLSWRPVLAAPDLAPRPLSMPSFSLPSFSLPSISLPSLSGLIPRRGSQTRAARRHAERQQSASGKPLTRRQRRRQR